MQLLSTAIFVGALAYAGLYHLLVEVLPYDDAFITFRYAYNLLAGHGLVYNVGERVFGSSTPLYTLWLSLLGALLRGADLPDLAVRGNGAFYLAAALLVAGISWRLGGCWPLACLLGTAFAVEPSMLLTSTGGMESSLFLALALGVIWALLAGHLRMAAVLAGASFVTRPEGALFVGLCCLWWLSHGRRLDGWLAVAALGPVALWIAFATAYYGTPLPHSVIAKSKPLYLLPPDLALREIQGHFLNWTGASHLMAAGSQPGWVWLAPAVLGSLLLLRPAYTGRTSAWLLPLAFWGLVAFYAATNPLMFDWYYPILYAFWLLAVAQGPFSVLAWRPHDSAREHRAQYVAGLLLLALTLALVLVEPVWGSLTMWQAGRAGPEVATPDRERIRAYRDAAALLNTERPDGRATLAGPEVGALGYYFHGHVYDAAGLVSPQALPYMPVPLRDRASGVAGAISTPFVEATHPDFVASMPTFSRASIDVNSWFQANYRLLKRLPLPQELWESRDVLVYEHTEPSAPVRQLKLDAFWDQGIHLTRAELPAVSSDSSLAPITLFWESTDKPTQDWKVFVHLLDDAGMLRAQDDSFPEAGHAPTSTWRPGEKVIDRHELRPGAALTPGRYRIVIGFYDQATGARLARSDGSDSFELPEAIDIRW